MSATDTAPLLDRVEEVVCDGQGIARTLAAADRFQRGVWPGADDDKSSINAQVHKRVIVTIDQLVPRPEEKEMGSSIGYVVTTRLDMLYFLRPPVEYARIKAMVAIASLDAHKVRRALCYPGNLEATQAGAQCGLASHCLRPLAWTARLDTKTNRLMVATMRFVGDLYLAP